jgi:PAS domain-containing protein
MHFIGMLAFHLEIPIGYKPKLTLLSALPGIAAALFDQRLTRQNTETLAEFRETHRELQKSTEKLSGQEILLSTITSEAHDAVILLDYNGLVNYWNPAAEQMYGYTKAEMIG